MTAWWQMRETCYDGEVPKPTTRPPVVTSWKPGQLTSNPMGLRSPDRQVIRSIRDALDRVVTADEFAQALWAIAAGIDPFAPPAPDNPDGLPTSASPPPWGETSRMAALKMIGEWKFGKPMQGHVVEMIARDTTAASLASARTHAIDVGALAPAARAALRLGLRAALGGQTPATVTLPVLSHIDVPVAAEAPIPSPPDPPTSPTDPTTLLFPESTNIARVEFDPPTGVAEVFFHSARGLQRYRFGGFDAARLREWRDAPSAGAWFAREVQNRPERHPPVTGTVTRAPGATL